jgi:hypothetical protein
LGLLGLFMPWIRCIKALLASGPKTIEDLWVTETETRWMFGRHDMHLKPGVSASGNTDRHAPCGSSRVVPARGRISAFIRHTMRCYDVLSQTRPPKRRGIHCRGAKVASQCHIHVPPSENCPRAWRAGSDCAARGNKSQQAGASLADVERQLAAPLWGLPH